jgi:hypothetical protein
MNNSRFKVLIACAVMLLATVCGFYFVDFGEISTGIVNASYSTSTSNNENVESNQFSYTNSSTGVIPFSLFTSTPDVTSDEYVITDYTPTFTASTSSNNTLYYSMDDDSVPYIMLSSSTPEELLNKTLYFNFNDINGATTSTTAEITRMSVQGSVLTASSQDAISIYCPTNSTNATNLRYAFAVNLLSLVNSNGTANEDAQCPYVISSSSSVGSGDSSMDKLGGNGEDNDVSYRTGLYTFLISYTYTDNNVVSNTCIFELSFYIIDYGSYVESGENPLTFQNTDTYQYTDSTTSTIYDTDYELYNYDYENEPIINYDASKFGLNFSFTSGSNVYNFSFSSFSYTVPTGYTGKVTLDCTINNVLYQYFFYTKSVGDTTYYASFDFGDFQENMIAQNSTIFKTNSFQGIYAFNLSLLLPSTDGNSFISLPSSTIDDVVEEQLTCKKLAIFGYELKYTDYSTQTRQALVKYDDNGNLITKTSVISANDYSSDYYISIPDSIAITNQTPLRFDNLGTLTSLSAKYVRLDYNSVDEDDVLNDSTNYLGLIKNSTAEDLTTNLSTLDTLITSSLNTATYTQGNSITVDGIYIMKLEYSVTISLDFSNDDGVEFSGTKNVIGVQYIVFEINSNVQKLYIQAIDTGSQYLYDFNSYTNLPVRVGIKNLPNGFMLPTTVTYTRSATFSSVSSNSGTLTLKTSDPYSIGDSEYNYYVTSNSNSYTFSQDGKYTVIIKISTTSSTTSLTYTFNIDSDSNKISGTTTITNAQKLSTINNLVLNTVTENTDGDYVKTSSTLTKDTSGDIYITSQPFSASWTPTSSGASESVYVAFMEETETTDSTAMFGKEGTTLNQYWITNSFVFGDVALYEKSSSDTINGYSNTVGQVLSTQVYTRNGLYFFFIYDQAGNSFYFTVLIDNTSSTILQGKWSGTSEASSWVSNYDKENNSNNTINSDTILYFGTHKALLLPDIASQTTTTIINPSYTKSYDIVTGNEVTKTNFSINFYQTLSNFTTYVKQNSTSNLLDYGGATSSDQNYYFLLPNTSVVATDPETNSKLKTFTTYAQMYRQIVYATQKDVNFTGENTYLFTVANQTGVTSKRQITMSFDVVQGTFYAYNSQDEQYAISQGAGTNLNILKFTYTKDTLTTANYYKVTTLYYQYYAFVLDATDANYSQSSYPFSSTVTYQSSLTAIADDSGLIYTVDGINVTYDSGLGLSGVTKPGKYVITRVYQGGTYNKNTDGTYTYVGTGGSYYKNDDNQYVYLFETDTLTRSYTVYVDHSDIIVEGSSLTDAVGDNISITLGTDNSTENQWSFKEFYKTSLASNSLTTNKVPVKINVPYSKYFVSTSTVAKQAFARLSLTVYYSSSTTSATYIADNYNATTGMLTCSALPTDDFIFSSAGRYTVVITDNTEETPTTYTFVFYITYSSPEIDIYTHTYTSSVFTDTLLTNEDDSTSFATNIKSDNGSTIASNKLYLEWSDPETPYLAQIDKIVIATTNTDGSVSSFGIKLSSVDKNTVISSLNGVVNLTTFGIFTNLSSSNNFVLSIVLSYYNPSSPYEEYDGVNYYRYSYVLALSMANELTYNITVSYISSTDSSVNYDKDDNSSFADSSYSLTIDRTKPNTNINTLINAETLLSSYYTDKNQFKEENFDYVTNGTLKTPTSLTYAFGVPTTYTLTYNSSDTVSYFYVRSYNKYNKEYSSITPDMIDTIYDSAHSYYENQQYFSGYPRFSEVRVVENTINIGSEVYYKISYSSGTTLYSLIKANLGITTPTGFYEIIERDTAGNYRTFTVYFSAYTNTYQILQFSGTQKDSSVATRTNNAITATEEFNLTSISSVLGWGYVTIKNETLGTSYGSTISLSPSASAISSDTLSKINAFLSCDVDSRFSLTLSRYNSTFPSSVNYINVITNESTAYLSAPTIQETSSSSGTTYSLVLPTSTATTYLYLEKFSLYYYSNSTWQATTYIYTSNVPKTISGLSSGIYKAVYKDNYNASTYFYILYVGEFYLTDFSEEVSFSLGNYVYDSTNDVYYSGGNVVITYESNIYIVKVNGVTYSGTSLESTSSKYASYNCKTFTLSSDYSYDNMDADYSVGGTTTYEIDYYDVTDGSLQKTITIIIFDYLPEILLTNNSDQTSKVTSTLEESSSQITNAIVNIDYGTISGCTYEELNDSSTNSVTVAKLYTRNEDGEYESYKVISAGEVVSEEGYYRLDITNSLLGNTRSVYFVIQFGDFPLYTLYANDEELESSSQETLDISSTTTANSSKFTATGTSQTVVKTIYNALSSLYASGYLKEVVDTVTSQARTEYDLLVSNLGFSNGTFVDSNVGIANVFNVDHYYSIYSPTIVYNSNIELNVIELVFKDNVLDTYFVNGNGTNTTPDNVGRNYWTTIYIVYSLKSPIKIELFAFTKVPTSTSLISGNIYYNSTELIDLSDSSLQEILTNNEIKNSTTTINWNMLPAGETAKWYNQGNFVYMLDKYSLEDNYSALDYTVNAQTSRNYSSLSGSGNHKIMFMDLAGNTHQFSTSSFVTEKNVFNIVFLDQVIYTITHDDTEYDPIQYGVFNGSLSINLDQTYLSLLSNLKIRVYLNGTSITDYTVADNVYTFSQTGKYIVKFDAQYSGKDLNTATYNFTILSTTASSLAFEYPSISGYEIVKVIKDSKNITSTVLESDGSLFVTAGDSASGSGYYTVTLKYGDNDDDLLEFSFLISDFVPTISCNVEYGETTTGDIVLSFNASYIYTQLGDCYVNILVYNSDSNTFYTYQTVTIDENLLSSTGATTITISTSNSYFVQVKTLNGNIVSSFRVNKTDPLNTFAIIAIVIASLAAIVLIIVIIKLRTRMRVR